MADLNAMHTFLAEPFAQRLEHLRANAGPLMQSGYRKIEDLAVLRLGNHGRMPVQEPLAVPHDLLFDNGHQHASRIVANVLFDEPREQIAAVVGPFEERVFGPVEVHQLFPQGDDSRHVLVSRRSYSNTCRHHIGSLTKKAPQSPLLWKAFHPPEISFLRAARSSPE